MATSTVPPAPPVSESLLSASRALALGLLWGGCMLFILGWWLGIKHEDLSRLVVLLIWLLAAGSFGCGVWHYLTLARPAVTPEIKHAALAKHRTVLGLFLAVGGLILVGLALYLGSSFGLAAFGEVVGMCLVGLIAVASGCNLIKGERAGPEIHPFFELLRRSHGPYGLAMLIAGIILGATAVVLILVQKLGQDWFPEMAGLLFFGLLGIVGGIWLILSQSDELTTARMRIFVLVVGGVAGLILSLGALARAFVWRDEVFGGMRAWQGDRGWHLWLCAYVELIGLGLMFTSLLLARTDIRSSAVLRRVLYGYNAVLTGLLLLAMLAVLNIVLFALFPFSFEWSKSRGAHTLSTSTKNFLNNLREPTTIFVLLPRDFITTELKNFLENCQNQSTKLEVKYLSPHKDFEEYENLAKRFPESLSGRVGRAGAVDRGILIVYGAIPADLAKKVPHAFVPSDRLAERQQLATKEDGKVVVVFKGESEIMNELSSLAQDRKKRKVYVLQGNGEPDVNEKEPSRRDLRSNLQSLGCGFLVERLKKDQYDIQGLSFAPELPKDKTANLVYAKETGPEKRKEVPDDAEAVLIVGPGVPLGASILEALERYMDRGGSLVVYFDTIVDAKNNTLKTTGLEDFVRKYGVLVGKDFAMRVPVRGAPADPRLVFATVPRDTTNDLAKDFLGGEPLAMDNVRIIRPDPSSQKYKVEVLMQLDPREPTLQQLYWEETAVQALTNPETYVRDIATQGVLKTRISSEPIPVAVAVSEKLLDPGSGKERLKPRIVVFGDAEFISNLDVISAMRQGSDLAFDWTASILGWLSAKKTALTGPRTKESTSYTINPLQVDVERMRYLPGWLMMLSVIGLGGGIWVVRRR